MSNIELKKKYNETIARVFAAIDYYDKKSPEQLTDKDKGKTLKAFHILLSNQQTLAKELGLRDGDKEIIEGFTI